MRSLICFFALVSSLPAVTYNCSPFSLPGGNIPLAVNGYNTAGTATGYYRDSGGSFHGFLYNPGTGYFISVDYPGAERVFVYGINNNGTAVASAFLPNSPPLTFFTIDASGGQHPITVASGYQLVDASDINDSGDISATVREPNSIYESAAVIAPDGTVTIYTRDTGPGGILAKSVNNARTLLELIGSTSQLVDSSGNITTIRDMNFPPDPGLPGVLNMNNTGTVLGLIGENSSGEYPERAFTFDSSSGAYSEPFCPNLTINSALHGWGAINDNGVLIATDAIATPVPGLAQLTFTPSSITFPSTAAGTASTPQTLTLANTGNARLDIGSEVLILGSGSGNFSYSGCRPPFSLDPGASCTMTIYATPAASGTSTEYMYFEDSAPNAPHNILLSITGTGSTAPPPSCSVNGTNPGPPASVTFVAQDTTYGISSISVVQSTNASTNIPSFNNGTTGPVYPTATQIDSGQPSSVEFQVTNTQNSSATCSSNFSGGGGGGPAVWTGLGGSIVGRPSVTSNSDGRLEVVAYGSDSHIDDFAQSAPGGSWNGSISIGGYITGNAVTAANQNGDLEAFARGGDNALWTTAQSSPGAWSGSFATLGGTLISDSAVGINSNGTLDVFVLGSDNGLWHNTQTAPGGSWSGWSGLGGSFTGLPAVVANQDGRLQVFARGTDNALWTLAQITPGGSWSAPVSLGGFLKANPAAALNTNGIVQAFVVGGDTSIWTIAQASAGSSGFGSFTGLGGSADADPSIAVNQDGRLEVFVLGGDNALWHNSQTQAGSSNWAGWASLQGGFQGAPSAIRASNGEIAVFVRNADNTLGLISQTSPGAWN